MERAQTKMETDLTTPAAAGREELLVKEGVQACSPDIWHTAWLLRALASEEVAGGCFVTTGILLS